VGLNAGLKAAGGTVDGGGRAGSDGWADDCDVDGLRPGGAG
jgi:hypothetical protein